MPLGYLIFCLPMIVCSFSRLIRCNPHGWNKSSGKFSTLGTNQISFEPKYLGLPTPDERMKSERFQAIQERLSKRLSAYIEKELSMGGKEIMIKAVGQAFLYILWASLNCRMGCVIRWNRPSRIFGGAQKMEKEKYIGLLGENWHEQKVDEGRASKISSFSTNPC